MGSVRKKSFPFPDNAYAIILSTIFLLIGAIVAWRHEMWRDEIQAWLIARDSPSLIELFKTVKRYDGIQDYGIEKSISPHKLRHFFLLWLKKQGIDDALIQPYSGHDSRQSLEIYSRIAIAEAQKEYNNVMVNFPI